MSLVEKNPIRGTVEEWLASWRDIALSQKNALGRPNVRAATSREEQRALLQQAEDEDRRASEEEELENDLLSEQEEES